MHSIFVLARMSFIGSEFTTTSLYSTELLHCLTWVEEFPLGLFLRFLYVYRTRAIISRGLYFFYPTFTAAAAYTADNLCTKQGNVGLKSAAYKREWLQIKSGL